MIKKGLIVKGLGGLYEIETQNGERFSCKAKGAFRHDKITPTVGDFVTVREDKDGKAIEDIIDRKSCLIRPPLANLDVIFIVISASHPSPVLDVTDKLISIAEYNSIEPVIIINKNDLGRQTADETETIYKKSGFKVISVGVDSKNNKLSGFVKENARGKISAFAGASGVGKSTVINSVFPKLSLETGDVSKKTERGKHTTRHVELFSLSYLTDGEISSGYIADTPGFSMLDFVKFDFFRKDDLVYTFREFQKYLGKCKYTKCSHTKEDGCKIIEAVEKGDIPESRHNSYLMLWNDLKNKHDWN